MQIHKYKYTYKVVLDVTEEGTGQRPGRLLKDSKTQKNQIQKIQNLKTKVLDVTEEGTGNVPADYSNI